MSEKIEKIKTVLKDIARYGWYENFQESMSDGGFGENQNGDIADSLYCALESIRYIVDNYVDIKETNKDEPRTI